MYAPDKQTFLQKAEQGNLIPVWCELLADQDTPVSAYERLRNGLRQSGQPGYSFLLESVEGGEHIGRFSFLGCNPTKIIRSKGSTVEIETKGEDTHILENAEPLSILKQEMERYKAVPDPALPRFFGGAVGYMGYDIVSQFEKVPLSSQQDLDWPDMIYVITDTILIFDRVTHTLKVVANAYIDGDPEQNYDDAIKRIEQMCEYLSTPASHLLLTLNAPTDDIDMRSNVTPEAFKQSVEKAKEYIRAGDIIQVVLSQRFEIDYTGDSLDVYRALRSINPSPYMFCLDYNNKHIVGSSPEIHVRCEDGVAEIRPIAGTRPRSADTDNDKRLANELLEDPKERAEHIMLVDLARNDLGRVCNYGSVSTPELMVIERYSHVMHIVSDVRGTLTPEADDYEVMKATFPAGTVSGAPKIRAMEIIAELEPAQRGPYAGAIGYFSFNGNLDSCITIRTALLDGEKIYVQAGAGIVADSDPQKELEETQNKARGIVKAIAMSSHYASTRSKGAVQ